MGIKVKDVSVAQIEELRQKFNDKLASSPPAVAFHPDDIKRIGDNLFLQRFLEIQDLDVEKSLAQLWETLTWRQSYGTNDLTVDKLNQEYLNEGGIFVHNTDVEGVPMLIFNVKLHNKSKSLDDILRIVIYWVERLRREQHLTKITLFFDMDGTGLATMDMDFVKRIIELFKQYYPNTLNFILVFELAFLLNAAFKIVKNLLPAKAVEILKMVSKKDITQYVAKENCLTSWGGSDDYVYSFVPEQKKVTFANCSPMVLNDLDNSAEPHTPQTPTDNMLQLDPCDFVNFDTQTAEAVVNIKNVAKIPVTFKIQTTSPEKFRVRPRCGVLSPNENSEVGIWLKSEHSLSEDAKDKFLIMAMPAATKDCAGSEVADMWRNKPTNSPDVEQHRLVCRMDESGGASGACGSSGQGGQSQGGASGKGAGGSGRGGAVCPGKQDSLSSAASKKSSKPMDLQQQAEQLANQMRFQQHLQYVTLLLLLMLAVGFGFLLYQQQHGGKAGAGGAGGSGSCSKGSAFSCGKRK